MNSRLRAVLSALFQKPTRGDIRWQDVEALLKALGCSQEEGRGSRVRFALGTTRLVLHRPHPSPTLKKGAVDSLRDFLIQAEVKP